MKIGVENESLHLWQQNSGMTPFDFIDKIAGLGAEGVQLNLVPDYGLDKTWGFLGSNEIEYLNKIRKLCDKHNFYIELDTRNLDFEYIISVLEIAHRLEAEVVRSYIPVKPQKSDATTSGSDGKYDIAKARQNFDISSYTDAIPRLKSFIPYLKKYRVKLALENHEYETSEELVNVIEGVGSPWVGLFYDFGNSMMAWEDPMQALKNMAPHVLSTHVKDHIIVEEPEDVYGHVVCGVPIGEGNLNIEAQYRDLLQHSTLKRVHIEMCFPYAAQFKRSPGTGGVDRVGEGAFMVRKHPYPYEEIKPLQYYYPQEVSKEYLHRLSKDQEEGLVRSLEFMKKLRDKVFYGFEKK